jgi:hypothetical protein
MTKEQFEREKNYCVAVIIAKRMLKEGIITKEDFNKLLLIFVQKYRPVIGSL